jgi:DNA-binding NarL/FixJ family response regulator
MKRVFVVDDHTAIREGFKAILERSGSYTVSGEASNAEETLERLDAGEAYPDVFMLDVSLPGRSGLELAADLRSRCEAPLVILTMHRRYDYIVGAFRAGAHAYVAKDAGADSIVAALDAGVRGEYYLDPASLKLFVDEASALGGGAAKRETNPALSDRELEVLRLLAAGKRAEEIASALGLSQKTVENHLSNITSKLGARDRFELYRLAARMEGGIDGSP